MKEKIKRKKYIWIIIIFVVVLSVLSLASGYYIEKNFTQKLNREILYIMQDSSIIRENLGVVKDAKKKTTDSFKKYNDEELLYVNYSVTLENDEQLNIKVITKPSITESIYAYEIGGNLYYEDLEKYKEIKLKYFKLVE